MFALSESVMKIRLKRTLAQKSRWRDIHLAIKPRYLENHASQIKSYYGTLSGSHGRSFRIRHENVLEATPGGGLTMTSYLVGNKTSLSRKPCIADIKSLSITKKKQQILILKTYQLLMAWVARIKQQKLIADNHISHSLSRLLFLATLRHIFGWNSVYLIK